MVDRAAKTAVLPCKICYGYGLWAMGDPSPMGRMDASDGMPTIPCPECGANANPLKITKKKDNQYET